MRTLLTYVLAIALTPICGVAAASTCALPTPEGRAAARQQAIEFAMNAEVLAYGHLSGAIYPVSGPCDPSADRSGFDGFQEVLEIFEIDRRLSGRDVSKVYLRTGHMSRFDANCALEVISMSNFSLSDYPSEPYLAALVDTGQGTYSTQGPCINLDGVEEDILAALGRDPGEQE